MTTAILTDLKQHIQQKLVGNQREITLLLTALLAGGHVLLEDDPGSGKTALSKALADSLALTFKRVQCTPDLLPSDLTGINVYQPAEKDFAFIAGPIFTEILLADELNRATPRTQASLLEAMAEKQVTIDGQTRPLSELFFVIATQNPLETAGTFPLPEAQLDRFLFQFSLQPLSREGKKEMLEQVLSGRQAVVLTALFDHKALLEIRTAVKKVVLQPIVLDYLLRLTASVSQLNGVLTGISNRGLIQYTQALQSYAYLKGRDFVTPEDVQELAVPVLAHRLFYKNPLTTTAKKAAAIQELLAQIEAPTETWQ